MTAVIGDRPTLAALSYSRGMKLVAEAPAVYRQRYIRTYRKSLLSADKIPDHVFANFARLDTAVPTIIVSFDLRGLYRDDGCYRGSKDAVASYARQPVCNILNKYIIKKDFK